MQFLKKNKKNKQILKFLNFFEIFRKMFCSEHRQLIWSPNFVCFALSLTIAEIYANWCFFNFFKKFEIFKKIEIFEMFKNVLLWSLTILVTPKFRPFRSVFYGFWVLKFNIFINHFLDMILNTCITRPPFGQF